MATLRNPGDRANRQHDDLVGLAFDVDELSLVETAALQPEPFKRDCPLFVQLAEIEARHKLQLVDCNFEDPSRPLSEGI